MDFLVGYEKRDYKRVGEARVPEWGVKNRYINKWLF